MPVLKEVPKEDAEVKTASQLPKPVGYKILIALPEIEEKTEGGVIKPDYIRDWFCFKYGTRLFSGCKAIS